MPARSFSSGQSACPAGPRHVSTTKPLSRPHSGNRLAFSTCNSHSDAQKKEERDCLLCGCGAALFGLPICRQFRSVGEVGMCTGKAGPVKKKEGPLTDTRARVFPYPCSGCQTGRQRIAKLAGWLADRLRWPWQVIRYTLYHSSFWR